ncbi:hypothetical protein PT2222_400019 [Paraburkholderia tropica]
MRHRTSRTRNCLSRSTFLAMAFKLIEAAEQTWRKSALVIRFGCNSGLKLALPSVRCTDSDELVRLMQITHHGAFKMPRDAQAWLSRVDFPRMGRPANLQHACCPKRLLLVEPQSAQPIVRRWSH